MTGLTCDIQFEINEPVKSGLFLLLINPVKSYPHLALVHNGLYFSLGAKKQSIGDDFHLKWKSLKRKNSNILFFQLKDSIVSDNTFAHIKTAFQEFKNLTSNDVTCLNPVLKALSEVYKVNLKAETVLELLPNLIEKNFVTACFSYGISAGEFLIPYYSRKDVTNYINSLLK